MEATSQPVAAESAAAIAPPASAPAAAGRLPARLAAGILLFWALGSLGLEGLEQAAAGTALVFAAVAVATRRSSLARDLRVFAVLALALAAWQALSPLLALATGTMSSLPRSGRWTQALDAVAPLSLAVVVSFGVPWIALAWLLGLGWLFQTLLGVFQFLVPWPWASLGPIHFALDRLRENINHDGGPIRRPGIGLFFHRLKYAHTAVAALGTAVAVFTMTRTWRLKAVGAAAILAMLAVTAITYARAALAAALVATMLGLLLFLKGRWRLAAAGVLVVGAVACLALSAGWRERLAGVRHSLVGGERAYALKTSWEIIKGHPILGVGFGNYTPATTPYQQPQWPFTIWQHPHNAFALAWAETGIVGLALYLGLHLALAVALWRRARRGSIVAAGALLSQVGFHVLGLFHYPQFHSGVMLAFALAWGLGLAPSAPGLPRAAAEEGGEAR